MPITILTFRYTQESCHSQALNSASSTQNVRQRPHLPPRSCLSASQPKVLPKPVDEYWHKLMMSSYHAEKQPPRVCVNNRPPKPVNYSAWNGAPRQEVRQVSKQQAPRQDNHAQMQQTLPTNRISEERIYKNRRTQYKSPIPIQKSKYSLYDYQEPQYYNTSKHNSRANDENTSRNNSKEYKRRFAPLPEPVQLPNYSSHNTTPHVDRHHAATQSNSIPRSGDTSSRKIADQIQHLSNEIKYNETKQLKNVYSPTNKEGQYISKTTKDEYKVQNANVNGCSNQVPQIENTRNKKLAQNVRFAPEVEYDKVPLNRNAPHQEPPRNQLENQKNVHSVDQHRNNKDYTDNARQCDDVDDDPIKNMQRHLYDPSFLADLSSRYGPIFLKNLLAEFLPESEDNSPYIAQCSTHDKRNKRAVSAALPSRNIKSPNASNKQRAKSAMPHILKKTSSESLVISSEESDYNKYFPTCSGKKCDEACSSNRKGATGKLLDVESNNLKSMYRRYMCINVLLFSEEKQESTEIHKEMDQQNNELDHSALDALCSET